MAIADIGLQIRDTNVPQLLLEWDALNFTTFQVTSFGDMEITPSSGFMRFAAEQLTFATPGDAFIDTTVDDLVFKRATVEKVRIGSTSVRVQDGFFFGAGGTVRLGIGGGAEQIRFTGATDAPSVVVVPGVDGGAPAFRVYAEVDTGNSDFLRMGVNNADTSAQFRVQTGGVPLNPITNYRFSDVPVVVDLGLTVAGVVALNSNVNISGLLTIDNPGNSAFIRLRPNDVVDLSWDFRADLTGDFVIRSVSDGGATVFAPFRITHGATPVTTINGSKLVAPGEITFVIDTDSGFTANGNDLINIKVAGINRFVVRGDAAPVTAIHAQSTTEALRINGDIAPFISFFSTASAQPGRQAYIQAGTGSTALIFNLENDLNQFQFSMGGAAKVIIFSSYTRILGNAASLRLTSTVLDLTQAVYAGFFNSDQSQRWGYVGKGGGSDGTIHLVSDTGKVSIYTQGAHSIEFSTSAVRRWSINSGGTLFPEGSNLLDLGGSGNFIRTLYTTNIYPFRLSIAETWVGTTSFSNTWALGRNLQYQGSGSPFDANGWRYIGEDVGNNERGSVLIVGANGNNNLQFLSADAVATAGGVPTFTEIFRVESPVGADPAAAYTQVRALHTYVDGQSNLGQDTIRFATGYFDNLVVTNPPWGAPTVVVEAQATVAVGAMGGNNERSQVVPMPGLAVGDTITVSMSNVAAAGLSSNILLSISAVAVDSATVQLVNTRADVSITPDGAIMNLIATR